MPADRYDHSEDLFADTRMSFGEHIEDLRTHLMKAIKGLAFCITIGFVLDSIGLAIGANWIGIGRPMMDVITNPVREQLNAFYDRKEAAVVDKAAQDEVEALRTIEPKPVKVRLSAEALAKLRGGPTPEAGSEPVVVEIEMFPHDLFRATKALNRAIRPTELTALAAQEVMVVYFKVSIICGFVIASPWVFWHVWSFVAAGLYPNEKRLVNYWLPISLCLFLAGVLLCQFAVIPRSIAALLWFNQWLGITPDLRLSEWLALAIWLPVIFGVAFQTPLVMMVLNRIGIMTVERYLSYWRIAVFVLAVITLIIVPTTDVVTWFALWLPMVGLYFFGIYLCWLAEKRRPAEFDMPESESDELVEV